MTIAGARDIQRAMQVRQLWTSRRVDRRGTGQLLCCDEQG